MLIVQAGRLEEGGVDHPSDAGLPGRKRFASSQRLATRTTPVSPRDGPPCARWGLPACGKAMQNGALRRASAQSPL